MERESWYGSQYSLTESAITEGYSTAAICSVCNKAFRHGRHGIGEEQEIRGDGGGIQVGQPPIAVQALVAEIDICEIHSFPLVNRITGSGVSVTKPSE